MSEKFDINLLDAQIGFLRREATRVEAFSWGASPARVMNGIIDVLTTVRRQTAMTGMSDKPIDRPDAFTIRGHNEFYQGWLARVLCLEDDPAKPEGWRRGWIIAAETPQPETVLPYEIHLKHIIVEKS